MGDCNRFETVNLGVDVGGNAIVVNTDWGGDDDIVIITQNKQ